MDFVQERAVQILVLRQRFIDADVVDERLDAVDGLLHCLACRAVFDDIVRHTRCQFLADLVGFRREVLVVQERNQRDGDQQIEDGNKGITPTAQQGGHLLLMRGTRRAGVARADPRRAVHDRVVGRHNDH